MMRQMTVDECQENVVPPKSRPSRSMSVTPMIVRLPTQSTALMPTTNGVFGLCTSKKHKSRMNVIPVIGRLLEDVQLALVLSLNVLESGDTLHHLHPEAPAPRRFFGQSSADDGASATGYSPHECRDSQIKASSTVTYKQGDFVLLHIAYRMLNKSVMMI